MGNKPVTETESTDESNDKLSCGASSMQGWRCTQEDAHNCLLDYDTNASFFAVYDGHGGHEVAQYCSQKLAQFIKDTEDYKEGRIEDALTLGFLKFDATLATPDVVKVLKQIAGTYDVDSDDEEENVNNLYEEAAMPIEKVIEKYTSNLANPGGNAKNIQAALLKTKKDKEETVGTSSASCSSSTGQDDKCGDGVSSSSEANATGTKEEPKPEANGSEDNAKAHSEVSNTSEVKEVEPAPSEKGDDAPVQNGEISTPSVDTECKNDVTSSSTPLENGTPSKKGKGKKVIKPEPVKSPVNTRPKRSAQQLYKAWLDLGEDSEESDEDDKTFEGPHEESSEEDAEGVNVSIDVSEEDTSENEEEENEDDDDDDDEEEEEESETALAFARNMKEEPGSDSGCTAVVALLKDDKLYVANAGDSRCVVCRNGKAIEMSLDHKPEDEPELQRIIKAGGEVTGDGRVNGGLNLSRAMGDHAYKQNKELSDREQMITALPDVKTLTITPNEDEFIVLACDGIWDSMTSQGAVDFVRQRILEGREKLSQICEELFHHCLSPEIVADAGCDNMTAVIVKFKSNNKRAVSPNPEENATKRAKTDTDSEPQVDTTV